MGCATAHQLEGSAAPVGEAHRAQHAGRVALQRFQGMTGRTTLSTLPSTPMASRGVRPLGVPPNLFGCFGFHLQHIHWRTFASMPAVCPYTVMTTLPRACPWRA